MTAPAWQAATLYAPGVVVTPTASPQPVATAIPNGTFESGDTAWTKGTGWTITNAGQAFQGSWSAQFDANGNALLEMTTPAAVTPGQTISASAMVQQGASSAGQAGARIELAWYTDADVLISASQGNLVDSGSGGAWNTSTVSGTAPATAAKVVARVYGFATGAHPLWVDNVQWDYVAPAAPSGLVYQAVQTDTARSAAVEPVWPTTLGVQVVDGGVTWEAISDTRIVWQAQPILESGATEPTWPTSPGAVVADNTIGWRCVVRNVTDENCPNSAVVAIVASKVFAVDGDIVRFSATADPLDWTTEQDAGYLPTGLQQANANDMAVLNQYRANLVAFNASSFQNWYVDPDPANMSILDQMDGIGSTWQRAAQSVGNELFYLSQLGVRSVGIANAAENLAAGDVGQPIDPLVRVSLAEAVVNGSIPLATYYPGAGQYWLAFPPSRVDISNPLASATVGVPVTHSYVVTGGVPPYTVTVIAGSLPAGLSMDTDGNITGTPTTAADYAWRVQAEDAIGQTDTLDEGIDLVEGIDGGTDFEVRYPLPVLLTDVNSYGGTPAALTAGAATGFNSLVDNVRVSPNGQFAIGGDMEDGALSLMRLMEYNTTTEAWDVIGPLPDLPADGTAFAGAFAWSPDSQYLAINLIGYQYPWIWARSGSTFTLQAAPDSGQWAGTFVSRSLVFDDTGTRLAASTNSSLDGVYLWTFSAGQISGVRNLASPGTNFIGGAPHRLAFFPGADSDYLVGGNPTYTFSVDVTTSPMTVANSVANNGKAGVFFVQEGNYVIAVGDAAVRVYSFATGALTLQSTTTTGIPATIADAALSADKDYLAIARPSSQNYPTLATVSAATPPVVTVTTDPPTLAGAVQSVSWRQS